ncbi:MAG: hypothetical protein DRI56_10915 [Chloroflexota bacterium]|nr:MAG: hypothetical protein DRI56_10915 [Chloroflexota bacterium]
MSSQTDTLKLAEKRRAKFRKLLVENETYPVATITYHGPDDQTATKISVGIVKSKEDAPIIEHWTGEGIAEDVNAAHEISQFLQTHGVERVITSESVMSCPHVEGVDYPEGETCPLCPFWNN